MSEIQAGVEREAGETKPAVSLRQAERRQMMLAVQCADDLVSATHPVRMVAVAGRDATDPELLVSLWLYACIRGIGSARELARRCEESDPFRWL